MTDDATTKLAIEPITPNIGAEVLNVKLSGDLSEVVMAGIVEAVHKHKVVFFRDQEHLDDAGHEAFADRLGVPEAHPTLPPMDGTRAVTEFDSHEPDGTLKPGGARAAAWHTDGTYIGAYPKASILRSIIVPKVGGDTLWANTAIAYNHLPVELRKLADDLWAIHSNIGDYGDAAPATKEEKSNVFTSTRLEARHPVVRIHPITGERSLVCGIFMRSIAGMVKTDSDRIMALLQDHVLRPEHMMRWRWRVGDVVIWDNYSTQHYACADTGDNRRVMRRVTLSGDQVVGIDGRQSETLYPAAETLAAE